MLDILKAKIRDIPDFPQQGVMFKDITPLLGDPQAFNMVINLLADRYMKQHVDHVIGVEARGLVVGLDTIDVPLDDHAAGGAAGRDGFLDITDR